MVSPDGALTWLNEEPCPEPRVTDCVGRRDRTDPGHLIEFVRHVPVVVGSWRSAPDSPHLARARECGVSIGALEALARAERTEGTHVKPQAP